MACEKEASMARPDVAPMFTKDQNTINNFFQNLNKCGQTQDNMVSHTLDRNDIGKVMGISPDETTLAIADACACTEETAPGLCRRAPWH